MRHVQTKSQEAKGKKSQIGTLLRQHLLPQSLLKLSQSTFILPDGKEGTSFTFFCPNGNKRPRADEAAGAPPRKMQRIQCLQSTLFGIDDNLQGERTCAPLFFAPLPLILSILVREMIQTRRILGFAAGTGQIKGLRKCLGAAAKGEILQGKGITLSFFDSFFVFWHVMVLAQR